MMSDPLARKTGYSREEYLDIEEGADHRCEYYGGEIFSMAGGSRNHSAICVNLIRRLSEAVDDRDCFVFDGNMKLDIAAASAFVYPDVMVVCGDIDFYENRTDVVRNPILIIEVLSPGTESFDRGKKFGFYRKIPSLREYLLVSQEEPILERFFRQEDHRWLYDAVTGLDGTVSVESIRYALSMKDLYHKVELETKP